MIDKLDGGSLDIEKIEMEKLRSVFPQCFVEGKLDVGKLLSLCGEYEDNDFERYRFEWKGKSEGLRLAQKRSTGTLRPCPQESVDWDNTQNLYIEGDNLEVLKLLQTAYRGKVKMIYIDPPYNTRNDFVYEDDFVDPIARYKEYTSQTTRSNPETMGRYHTRWLNLMFPRLILASKLLSEDGVIFISIDDKEAHNLRKLCDEVFWEANFMGQIIHKNNSMKNQSKYIGVSTEYVFVYAKNLTVLNETQDCWRANKKGAADINAMFNKLKSKGIPLEEIREHIQEMYSRPKYAHLSRWNKVDELGVFKDQDLSRDNGPKDYTIINPNTGKPCKVPERGWGKSYDELLRLQGEDLIWYGDDDTAPGMKTYITDDSVSVFDNFIFADTSGDKKMIDNLFGAKVFEFPKSLEMIKQLVQLCTSGEDIILDFFSGSGTTAHAVMQSNLEDGGRRKFIMVQLPEMKSVSTEASKAGYKNICEIGKERIRRVGANIKTEFIAENALSDTLFDEQTLFEYKENAPSPPDTGFRVFRLDTSNLKKWDSTPVASGDSTQMELLLDRMEDIVDTIKSDRTEIDMVYEVMLKMGVNLNSIVEVEDVQGVKIYRIGENNPVLVCLQESLPAGMVEKMAKKFNPSLIALNEKCFSDDTAMANAHYILKGREIELKLL